MPKRKKKSRADAPGNSGARSKKLYSAYLAEDLRSELRIWPKPDRARVGKLIQNVQENFGQPHLHSGKPSGMCALSRTSRQCAIGCELKVSSMIAVSTLMFAASFAGSTNRGSFKRSARPIPVARAGILSGVATRTNQMLSELLYTFSAAFAGFFRSCCGANFAPESAA
jgi:hypothetical protein